MLSLLFRSVTSRVQRYLARDCKIEVSGEKVRYKPLKKNQKGINLCCQESDVKMAKNYG